MKKMTRQEIFEKVAKHLLTQNAKAKGEPSGAFAGCLYYDSTTGRKCAIGCLIPQDQYDPIMEDQGYIFNNELVVNALISVGIDCGCNGADYYFIQLLQKIHDNHHVSQWKRYLRDFAVTWDLDIPEFLK
jgi:hypothetical protein